MRQNYKCHFCQTTFMRTIIITWVPLRHCSDLSVSVSVSTHQSLCDTFEQCNPDDTLLVDYFDSLTVSKWLNANWFAAFGPALIENLHVTN